MEREHGQVGAGDEHRRADDPVLAGKGLDQLGADRAAQHGQLRGERRSVLAQPCRDSLGDLFDRERTSRFDADDIGREHERHRDVLGAEDDRDDRDTSPARAPQVGLVAAAGDVDVHRRTSGIAHAHGRGGTIAGVLAREHARQLARAADDERLGVRDLQLLEQATECAYRYRKLLHERRRARAAFPRAWIESRTPIAPRVAIIDEPPTLTNGKGMPVIGAIPIVIPTLTKIWKSSATTIPAATIAE